MNSAGGISKTGIVNIRAIIWDLLTQWKAILIIAVLMALIMPGLKYLGDMKAYNNSLQSQQEETITSDISSDERIEEILSSLSEEDRSNVEYIIGEEEWIRQQKEYLKTSIIMNTNPANQGTLGINYKVSTAQPENLMPVMYSYLSCLYSDEMIENVGQAVDPDLDKKYIAELFNCDLERFTHISSAATDAVLDFRMIIPDDADVNAIVQAITARFTDYSAEIEKKFGQNEISLVTFQKDYVYNGTAVNNKNNITYAVYNLQNNTKNAITSYSDEAKAAIQAIKEIKNAEYEVADAKTANDENDGSEAADSIPEHPRFRKKYAAAGFILGAMIYALLYGLLVILRGDVLSSSDVGYYTGGRLIGEIYCDTEHKGIKKLLHSKIVNNIRHHGKLDEAKQTDKVVSSLEALYKRAEAENISLLCLPGLFSGSEKVIDNIVSRARENSVRAEVLGIEEDVDENQLVSIRDGIVIVGKGSNAAGVAKFAQLCKEYGINDLGNIYIEAV